MFTFCQGLFSTKKQILSHLFLPTSPKFFPVKNLRPTPAQTNHTLRNRKSYICKNSCHTCSSSKLILSLSAFATSPSLSTLSAPSEYLQTLNYSEDVFIKNLCYNITTMRKKYSTDLTDEQWAVIAPLLKGMRNRKWSKRELVNAVLYLVDNG